MTNALKFIILSFGLLLNVFCAAQANTHPKIVIGITVDQMRYDYLQRYRNDFSQDGFVRLMREGFMATNHHYNYVPTYTGPGHASIFTGTTPSIHGIIQNDWFDRSSGKMIYCSADSAVKGVGTESSSGQMSPQFLRSSTLGDALKLHTQQRSKVIGIALKDRGATLTAGRTADAAYWFVGGTEGKWISSTWYMNELPAWVNEFNSSGKPSEYLKQDWKLFESENKYDESLADNNAYETPFKGQQRPVFPYKLSELAPQNGNFEILKATPYGNSLTVDFAIQAIEKEQLGMDEFTDLLCVSFSSTDYVGHQFGMHSREIQDTYLRLDQDIARILKWLDQKFGKENYLLFLTADHGGAPTPSYMETLQSVGGYWKSDRLELMLEDSLASRYGQGDWIINESNQNIFLNRELIRKNKLSLKELQYEVAQLTLLFTEVHSAFTYSDLAQFPGGTDFKTSIENGFDSQRSGDVIYMLRPGYIEYGMTGTTHGSGYLYDTHVPLLIYGAGIQSGACQRRLVIPDIVATISQILRISPPESCTGQPIQEALKK
jgi:predicted AlkP superfamily pyrophosphatase or phosphodiesterase